MEYWDIHDAELQELFNVEEIEHVLDDKSFNLKERTILKFIINNPTKTYWSIINIFDTRDSKVFKLAIKCTSSEEEREKLKELKSTLVY